MKLRFFAPHHSFCCFLIVILCISSQFHTYSFCQSIKRIKLHLFLKHLHYKDSVSFQSVGSIVLYNPILRSVCVDIDLNMRNNEC